MSDHYSVKLDELKAERDAAFAAYWGHEEAGAVDAGLLCQELLPVFREIAECAYQKGFYQGLQSGVEHGSKLAAAVVRSDIGGFLEGFGHDSDEAS